MQFNLRPKEVEMVGTAGIGTCLSPLVVPQFSVYYNRLHRQLLCHTAQIQFQFARHVAAIIRID